jgi:hypothetical protein
MINYKLESKVPGVKVTLTPNPLNAKIEMTESAKREFALLTWMTNLFENYCFTSRFYLDPRCGKNVDGVYVPDPPNYEEAKFWMKRAEEIWFGEDGNQDVTVERIMQDDHVKYMLDALEYEHSGDCTCVACSCERCHAEDVLGINTLPSSKHVNYRLRNMWFEEYATPEQKESVRKRKEEFAKKYPPKPWTPDEATKQRWAAEDTQAKLVYTEHQRLYKEQEGL